MIGDAGRQIEGSLNNIITTSNLGLNFVRSSVLVNKCTQSVGGILAPSYY